MARRVNGENILTQNLKNYLRNTGYCGIILSRVPICVPFLRGFVISVTGLSTFCLNMLIYERFCDILKSVRCHISISMEDDPMKDFFKFCLVISVIGAVAYLFYKFLNDGYAGDLKAAERADEYDDWDDIDEMVDPDLFLEP